MSGRHWPVLLGTVLFLLSALVYGLHYLLFRDAHHIFLFLISDVAFVFVEVLLVTLIIHGLLEQRERRARLRKLHVVIGTFFSETGTGLLKILSRLSPETERLQRERHEAGGTADEAFRRFATALRGHEFRLETDHVNWEGLRAFLTERRDFLLRLLENPSLLEHEAFTDLLWAVFHLAEELTLRENLQGLPPEDQRHLAGDTVRVYRQLALQWLDHLEHLRRHYPYLFSLALRMNPFDRNASPVLEDRTAQDRGRAEAGDPP